MQALNQENAIAAACRRTDALEIFADDRDGFVHVVGNREQFEIVRADEFIRPLQLGLHPLQQTGPMFLAEEDQRELRDALRLHQRHHLEQLIQRAEAAGHIDEGDTVFGEADFAREEIMEMHRHIREQVARLLVRQFDVQTDGFALALVPRLCWRLP